MPGTAGENALAGVLLEKCTVWLTLRGPGKLSSSSDEDESTLPMLEFSFPAAMLDTLDRGDRDDREGERGGTSSDLDSEGWVAREGGPGGFSVSAVDETHSCTVRLGVSEAMGGRRVRNTLDRQN